VSFFKKMKKNTFIKSIGIPIYLFIKKTYMIFCNKVFGINKESIVFKSFGGKTYSDNPKAITEKLHEMNPNLNIFWLFIEPDKKRNIVPDYVNCVNANSIKALKVLATSKIWVDNFNKPLYLYKSNKQVYIQTWHGDRALKKILHDSTFAPKNFKLFETNKCDLIVTGSNFAEGMYKRAYRYNGEFLKVGSPRNDALIVKDKQKIELIKSELGIKAEYKILLYAPTLRRNASKNKETQKITDLDLIGIIEKLKSKTGNEWICLTRAHSAVLGLEGIPENNNIINVTEYEDMADLLQITDLLITDYSSSATDFILTNKPTILYQSDYQEYIKNDRTFYYDLKETGFLIAYNQEELFRHIDKIFKENTVTRNKKIQEFYGVYEKGLASKQVAEYVVAKINRRENS